MRRQLILLLVQVSILIPMFGYAQFNFTPLKTEVAFDNHVRHMHRDSKGYLWIGTRRHGVIRHDSYTVKVFGHFEQDSLSISNNHITELLEDKEGRLWIATMKGFNRFDYDREVFVKYNFQYKDNTDPYANIIMSILEDKKGNIWVLTGRGLYLYEADTNTFIDQGIELPSNLNLAKLTGLTQDHQGYLWLATDHTGLLRYSPDTKELLYLSDSTKTEVDLTHKKLLVDDYNMIWIATLADGVIRFDPKASSFYHFPKSLDQGGTNGAIIRNLISYDSRYMLFAIDQGGVNVYDRDTGKISVLSLQSDGVVCFHKDYEDILWVGTSRAGVHYFNPKKEQFKTFRDIGYERSENKSNIVGCFMQNSANKIWIGTDGNGVTKFDIENEKFELLESMVDHVEGDWPMVIRSMAEDPDGNVWIATWNKGISVYYPKDRKVAPARLSPEVQELVDKGPVWDLEIDQYGRTWIAMQFGMVYVLDRQGKLISRNFEDDMPLKGVFTSVYFSGEESYVTRLNQIHRYNEKTRKMELIAKNGAPETEILSLKFSSFGKVYVATYNEGLFVYNKDFQLVQQYSDKNGLPSMYIQSMEIDPNDNLWISHVSGITRYNPATGLFSEYNEEDGLENHNFFPQSSFRSSSGDLYFGSKDGFNSFSPTKISENPIKPPVYVTDFRLYNQEVKMFGEDGKMVLSEDRLPVVTLEYFENMFSIGFVAINFTGPGKNQYAYKLEGFDDDWIMGNARSRRATYTNIPPGEYMFKVKASNNTGLWNEEGAQLRIVIKPPFWRTKWFYTAMAFFLIASAIYLVKWREKRLMTVNTMLQQAVDDRTRVIKEQNTELDFKNRRLEEQQEEIQTQNEALMASNIKLSEQRDLVTHQNEVIKDLNQNLEQKIILKTAELQQSVEKLNKIVAELDRFIYSTSHELSAPLKSIRGLVDVARRDKFQNSQVYFEYIEQTVYKLEDVIQTFVTFSRNARSEVKYKSFNLKKFVYEIIDGIRYYDTSADIGFIIEVGSGVDIVADKSRLGIILNNLISNSIKYSDRSKSNSWIKVSHHKAPDVHELTIADNGLGIPEKVKPRIFEMFYRGASQSTGTGLGLYIVQEAVEHLKGDIEVSSEEGEGTKFVVRFPANLPEWSEDDA